MEMKSNILIFAGTTEGRELAEFLSRRGVALWVSVATEYGETLLPKGEGLSVHTGRMDEGDMEAFFKEKNIDLVVDATHPYAAVVSGNIFRACERTQTEYIRLLRKESKDTEDCIFVNSVKEAVDYLKKTDGNVLVTTGSKELSAFTEIPDYENRIFARVLSTPEVALDCAALGFRGKNLICMQGPFSRELNVAMLRQIGAAYLVTKDSGKAGGFEEKILAAREANAKVILIGRPAEQVQGNSMEEVKALLMKRLNLAGSWKISLVGMGIGSMENMTLEGLKAVEEADLLIGAERMLKTFKSYGKPEFCSYKPLEIRDFVYSHPEYEKVAVLLSGDVGFYSGARKLYEAFDGQEIQVYSGISSVVYFLGKLHTSWEDVHLLSLHGRKQNVIDAVKREKKVFALVGEKDGVKRLLEKLIYYGMDQVLVSVGERLSYPDEKIVRGLPGELLGETFSDLSVVLLENPSAGAQTTHGISDEEFIRGKVPMTKQGIRSISISRLGLFKDSIVYDVGAGTGSVSVEMARMAPEGRVYAVEKKEEAVKLLEENKQKFAVDNLEVVPGTAPEALLDLPVPTHVFIGGSSGNLRQILETVLKKNPKVRLVINAITLETVAESLEAVKTLPVTDTEIMTAMIGEAKKAGPYHLMMGQNPVYIISCTGGGNDES